MNDEQRRRLGELQTQPNRNMDEDKEMNLLSDLERREQELNALRAENASPEELQTAEDNLKAAQDALNGDADMDMEEDMA